MAPDGSVRLASAEAFGGAGRFGEEAIEESAGECRREIGSVATCFMDGSDARKLVRRNVDGGANVGILLSTTRWHACLAC
jgi:hypothetical protein